MNTSKRPRGILATHAKAFFRAECEAIPLTPSEIASPAFPDSWKLSMFPDPPFPCHDKHQTEVFAHQAAMNPEPVQVDVRLSVEERLSIIKGIFTIGNAGL